METAGTFLPRSPQESAFFAPHTRCGAKYARFQQLFLHFAFWQRRESSREHTAALELILGTRKNTHKTIRRDSLDRTLTHLPVTHAQPQAQRGERELLTSNAVPRASLEEKIPTLTILPILS